MPVEFDKLSIVDHVIVIAIAITLHLMVANVSTKLKFGVNVFTSFWLTPGYYVVSRLYFSLMKYHQVPLLNTIALMLSPALAWIAFRVIHHLYSKQKK